MDKIKAAILMAIAWVAEDPENRSFDIEGGGSNRPADSLNLGMNTSIWLYDRELSHGVHVPATWEPGVYFNPYDGMVKSIEERLATETRKLESYKNEKLAPGEPDPRD